MCMAFGNYESQTFDDIISCMLHSTRAVGNQLNSNPPEVGTSSRIFSRAKFAGGEEQGRRLGEEKVG